MRDSGVALVKAILVSPGSKVSTVAEIDAEIVTTEVSALVIITFGKIELSND